MGSWGFKPLDNDTALDWMPVLIDMDKNTLANTLSLLCNSIDELEVVLGAFIIDTYHNGLYSSELNLYDYDDWFKKLSETFNNDICRLADGEYGAICRVINEGAKSWGDREMRLAELNKLKSHIKNGTHRWDENEKSKKGRKKLKEYQVTWTQTLKETFTVMATSEEEAIEYVEENCDVSMIDGNDFDVMEVK